MKFNDFFHNLKREKKVAVATKRVFTGSCYIDELTSLRPVDYAEPEIIGRFLIEGEKIWGKKIPKMKLDQFNSGFLDEYINQIIELALSDIERQRIKHKNVLTDIRIGQESRIQVLKNELEQIEAEISILRNEVSA